MTELTTTLSLDAIDLGNEALDEWQAAERRAEAKAKAKRDGRASR